MDFEFIEDEGIRGKVVEAFGSLKTELQDTFKKEMEETTKGLKDKTEELLGEKKKLQALTEKFKDMDPDQAREALRIMNESEYAQLLKDGKIEEVIEKKTSSAISKYKTEIEELTEKLTNAMNEGSSYKSQYQRKMVDDEIRKAAIKAGIRPEALEDVLRRASTVFSLGQDDQVEARDKNGNLLKNKDKLILTPAVWVDGLKENAPHYWPSSQGANLSGGDDLSDSDITKKLNAALAKGDMKEYRKLRGLAK